MKTTPNKLDSVKFCKNKILQSFIFINNRLLILAVQILPKDKKYDLAPSRVYHKLLLLIIENYGDFK